MIEVVRERRRLADRWQEKRRKRKRKRHIHLWAVVGTHTHTHSPGRRGDVVGDGDDDCAHQLTRRYKRREASIATVSVECCRCKSQSEQCVSWQCLSLPLTQTPSRVDVTSRGDVLCLRHQQHHRRRMHSSAKYWQICINYYFVFSLFFFVFFCFRSNEKKVDQFAKQILSI